MILFDISTVNAYPLLSSNAKDLTKPYWLVWHRSEDIAAERTVYKQPAGGQVTLRLIQLAKWYNNCSPSSLYKKIYRYFNGISLYFPR